MQAITTKFLGATDSKGSRVKATTEAGSITIPYPHELSGQDVHAAAAMALVRKLGWTPENGYHKSWICGGASFGFVFVYGSDARDQYTTSFGA